MSVRQAPHTVLELLRLSTTYLAGKGCQTARLDAEVLLAEVLGLDRVGLYTNFDRPLQPDEVATYRTMISRRGSREPVAYIVGYKEFMSRRFTVDANVLIPRPETEHLVEAVVHEMEQMPPTAKIIDIGTGSGAIAVTLAAELPAAELVAVDISPTALAVAAANAKNHEVAKRINFLHSNLFTALPTGAMFDIIVSNPPYIPDGDLPQLQPEVRREPRLALCAGSDGLDIIRQIVAQAARYLKTPGVLALEIGAGQGAAVGHLASSARFSSVEIKNDYAGHQRVAIMRLGASAA